MFQDSGTSQNFIIAPQVTKYSSSTKKQLLYPSDPLEMHLAKNSSQHLSLPFADGA